MGTEMATSSEEFVNWVCGDRLHPVYLMEALTRSRASLRALSTGSTHKTIYFPTVERFRVVVPPMRSQIEFATEIEHLGDGHQSLAEANRRTRRTCVVSWASRLRRGALTYGGDSVFSTPTIELFVHAALAGLGRRVDALRTRDVRRSTGGVFLRASCLELAVHWLYDADTARWLAYKDDLSAMLFEPSFKSGGRTDPDEDGPDPPPGKSGGT